MLQKYTTLGFYNIEGEKWITFEIKTKLPLLGSASLGIKEVLIGLKGTVGFTLVTTLSTPLPVASEGVTRITGLGDGTLGLAGKMMGDIFGSIIFVEDDSSDFGRVCFVVKTEAVSCIRVLVRISDTRVGGGLIGSSGGSLSETSKYSSSSSSDLFGILKIEQFIKSMISS